MSGLEGGEQKVHDTEPGDVMEEARQDEPLLVVNTICFWKNLERELKRGERNQAHESFW